MSNAALLWAWGVEIAPTPKLVLIFLADAADCDDECSPSVLTIMNATGLSERGVRKALGELNKAGLISRILRPLLPTTYRVNVGEV